MHIESERNNFGSSRGREKLAGAVRSFSFDFKGKTVMDIGSSTGGFTAVALEGGAKKVIAVEKGSRQMRAPLRYDKRVELLEKTDIFELGREKFREVEVVVADVSFVSLTKVLKYAIMKGCVGVEFLVMLKPQFEAEEKDLVRGVVKNERIRRKIIKRFEMEMKGLGLLIVKKRDNELAGKKGNVERFYYLKN